MVKSVRWTDRQTDRQTGTQIDERTSLIIHRAALELPTNNALYSLTSRVNIFSVDIITASN